MAKKKWDNFAESLAHRMFNKYQLWCANINITIRITKLEDRGVEIKDACEDFFFNGGIEKIETLLMDTNTYYICLMKYYFKWYLNFSYEIKQIFKWNN